MKFKLTALALAAAAFVALPADGAGAHTDSDIIAVPAGEEATVKLKPTHGCGGSPTTEVAIQAPVAGASAGEVEGWTASVTDGGDGTTVLEWTGGTLPADATGEFPVTFTAPDTAGELLTFPAIQYCENGEELSWISGDPAAEFPAPRLLILPAGYEAAGDLDEIPADAPGRQQLAEIVDVDNPQDTTTTTTEPSASTVPATVTTAAPTTTAPPAETSPSSPADSTDDDSSNTPLIVGGIIAVVLVASAAATVFRRRSSES